MALLLLGWPKLELKKTSQTLQFSITILHYLVAEIDYKLFMLFYRVMSQDYAQKNSSQSDEN